MSLSAELRRHANIAIRNEGTVTQPAESKPATTHSITRALTATSAAKPEDKSDVTTPLNAVNERVITLSGSVLYEVPEITSHWYGSSIAFIQKDVKNSQAEVEAFIKELQQTCIDLDALIDKYDGASSTLLTLTASVGALALIIQTAITTTNLVSNSAAFQAGITATGSSLVGLLKLGGSFFAGLRDKTMTYKGDVLDLLNQVTPARR